MHHTPIARDIKNHIISSFPLQLSLYLNISLFPFHCILLILGLYLKFDLIPLTYRVILFSSSIVHLFGEAVRLCLGFYGNLAENISALSGFLITSSIIQCPTTIFLLLNRTLKKLPVEYALFSIFLLFNVVEIIFAVNALKRTADVEMKKFAKLIAEEQEREASNVN